MMMAAAPTILALILAFGVDPLFGLSEATPGPAGSCLAKALLAMLMAASVAIGIGLGLATTVRRNGPTGAARRGFASATYLVQATNLVVYGWMIHGLGWVDFVRDGLGLRGIFVVDELAILGPFLVAEVVGWWGLWPAARELRLVGAARAAGYLRRRARLAYGMLLPALVLFWAGSDLARALLGATASAPAVQIGVMAALGGILLVISPAFVRLTWPTSPLPPGPLRDRLEALAARFGFRFTDVLVWDTDGLVFNAVVTGALPGYRYILLSDALLAHLDEHEVAAVFGHEMGHVRHHHLAYFGLFFLGSLGVMALISQAMDIGFSLVPAGGSIRGGVELAKSAAILSGVGGYYWLVFGALSRRFERQADVFGCRAVSCGRLDCPPHADYYRDPGPDPRGDLALCRTGIRICVNALETVAIENGIRPEAASWRHGSIARRIEFLRGLEGHPGAERVFQRGIVRLRVVLGLMLASAVVLAMLSGAFEGLRGV